MPRWFLWTVLALISWGIWAILSKLIGDTVSPALSQALSTIGLIPVLVALVLFRPRMTGAHPSRGGMLAFSSGILACLGNIAYYRVLNSGAKAATVVPLTALYPLITIGLAVLFLKERLNRIQLTGIGLSLISIYLFNVSSEQGLLSPWLLVALIPITLWGLAGLLQKIATNDVSGELSAVWFLAAFVLMTVFILLIEPWPSNLTPRIWALVFFLGFSLALGNFAILAAFASGGKASVISPLGGLYPLISIPIAILALGERIGPRETVGIAAALAAVTALAYESTPPTADKS